MRALVLGCGSIGARHARNLASLGVEVVVHDPNTARASVVAAEVRGEVVPDREHAYAEVAIIATPTIEHAADAVWCLGRGLHTFVEKPLAATRAGLAQAAAAAEASDCVSMVACNLRFSDGYRSLCGHLASVGMLVSIIADFGWYLPAWRPQDDYSMSYSSRREEGGGVILDAAIHELDLVLDLAGPVTSVAGLWTASHSLGIDVEDAADLELRHQSGCISHIHADYLRRTYTRTCTVIGAEGTLVWDFGRGSLSLARNTDSEAVTVGGLDDDRNAMYLNEMRHFTDAVVAGRNRVNTLADAAATTAVALQVLEQGGP